MGIIHFVFVFVMELTVVATFFPLIGWLFARLVKDQSASLRCQVWVAVLTGLLVFPMVSPLLPRWSIVEETIVRTVPVVREIDSFAPETSNWGIIPSRHHSAEVIPVILDSKVSSSIRSLEFCVIAIWALGIVFFLTRMLVSLSAIARQRNLATKNPVPESLQKIAETISGKLGIPVPKLLVDPTAEVPMLTGIWSPTVILPAEHEDWSEPESRAVLLHELSHLKRNDPFWQFLASLVLIVYWFHPMVWFSFRQLRRERETACDDDVLLHGEKPQDYATLLLDIAGRIIAARSPLGLCLAMSETSQVEERIDAVLDSGKKRSSLTRRIVWGSLFVLFLIVLAAAFCSPFTPFSFLYPKTYTAKAMIQILSKKPFYIFEEKQDREYEKLVETQFALIRSPLILEKAMESPAMARMPFLIRKGGEDIVGFLAKKLKIQPEKNSELATIAFSCPDPADAETIVNSVVNAYFDYYETRLYDWNNRLIAQLNIEFNRQQQNARFLQDEIASAMEAAAKPRVDSGEPVNFNFFDETRKELHQAEIKVDTLQAELKALQELVKDPGIPVPARRAIDNDPTLLSLLKEQKELKAEGDRLKTIMKSASDPIIQANKDQQDNAARRIEEQLATLGETVVKKLKDEKIEQLEQQIWDKKVALRTQEFLVDQLKQKYKEQLSQVADRTVKVVDVSIQKAQLERIDKVLDQLQTRIVSLQTEMSAPPQIQLRHKATRPTKPD